MSEGDYEIEYLDEDADLIEQCVLKVPPPQDSGSALDSDLLVRDNKRKLREIEQPAPKKKKGTPKQSGVKPKASAINSSLSTKEKQMPPVLQETVQLPARKSLISQKRDLAQRKLLNIKIPDYDDPFCLPVVALRHTDNDTYYRLQNWNQMCLDRFNESDDEWTVNEKEPAVSSTREITFQCALNNVTGSMETTVKCKTVVKSSDGVETPSTFETLLPVYREKTTLRNFTLRAKKNTNEDKYVSEVLLNQEVLGEKPCLVAFKPNDNVTTVYEFVKDLKPVEGEETEPKRCLKETTVCKICSACYQTSWRGSRVIEKKNLRCPLCSRSYVSVYSLLAHIRTHDNADVRKHKRKISALLATVVDYHYKCRICQVTCSSIKQLKKHCTKHRGSEQFFCEVGQHTTV